MAGMFSAEPDNFKKRVNPLNVFKKGGVTTFGDPLELFKKPEVLEPPKVETPKAIPLPDDAEMKKQRRRSISNQLNRSGRQSTIYTALGQEDRLGG